MASSQQKLVLLLTSWASFTLAVRLPYAGMQISWNAFSKLTLPPTVRYGFSPHFLPFVSSPANAESVTYPISLTYGNHVRLTHLFPNTQYYYQPVHANESQIYSFKTALGRKATSAVHHGGHGGFGIDWP